MAERRLRVKYTIEQEFTIDADSDLNEVGLQIKAEFAKQPTPPNMTQSFTVLEVDWAQPEAKVLSFPGRR